MQDPQEEYHQYRIPVSVEFENVFTHFYFAENRSDHPVTKTLLPTFQTILLFCFGKASMSTREETIVDVDQCLFFGPVRQAFEYTLFPETSILVANFKEDAFFRFFGKIAYENHSVRHPDQLLAENCFTDLWHQLSEIGSVTEKVDHILEFSKPYLQQQDCTSQLLTRFENHHLDPVKTIAEQTHQTERNVQRKQKERFGYSVKEITRYNRFLQAIKIIENGMVKKNKINWFAIIDECGYYDQSQLIHDFKHFLHISPSQYVKFQQDICNPKSE
ncbi:AraC family transcriptional regulator [Chryseobacterium lactis]|uniref:AraC family transcriptional regulator n=1 Tax=Chryseobacterium lactis TaxID=1241981 RepID=A0A3G6RKH4_CHRLC|nr:AraC family transcriptional regulator [Chryseobacterium lactis]AZA80480.1 AraC family transcriptional regulator [Chryseobacterium lactis]AZB05482.1 AraC family transcriptional regulator [Chryseobacterium lactis]PNW11383.1 AraC family transcriptional regulator [Chryseobacterium lactis]